REEGHAGDDERRSTPALARAEPEPALDDLPPILATPTQAAEPSLDPGSLLWQARVGSGEPAGIPLDPLGETGEGELALLVCGEVLHDHHPIAKPAHLFDRAVAAAHRPDLPWPHRQ